MKILSHEWPYFFPEVERSLLAAYVLWMIWGLMGVHRFYLGKITTGILFLLTGGLLGLGWAYDLFTLPRQVWAFRQGIRVRAAWQGAPSWAGIRSGGWFGWKMRPDDVKRLLLGKAAESKGVLTVTEGVLVTGLPFEQVEKALREMAGSGYVEVRNHPDTGVIQYVFPELQGWESGERGTTP